MNQTLDMVDYWEGRFRAAERVIAEIEQEVKGIIDDARFETTAVILSRRIQQIIKESGDE